MIHLKENYRSHQSILEFSNKQFYGGILKASAPPNQTNWFIGCTDLLPNANFPIIFDHIEGNCMKFSSSYYNEAEAEAVIKYVRKLRGSSWNGHILSSNDIGIVTPYGKQRQNLKTECVRNHFGEISIATAEHFQGQEKPIMIISTVRTGKDLGFVRDPKVVCLIFILLDLYFLAYFVACDSTSVLS